MEDEKLPEDEKLDKILNEATELRFGVDVISPGSSPDDILNLIIDIRQRLDRIEEHMLDVQRAKARAHRAKVVAEAEAEEVWDQAVTKKERTLGSEDFVAPREKYAKANMVAFNERRKARQVTRRAALMDEAYSYLRTMHIGLDGYRQDCLAALKVFSAEAAYERYTRD